jgi:hypothetical protein
MPARTLPARRLAILCAVAGLSACATNGPATSPWTEQLRADGWKPGATVMSIPDFRIDGFKPLDDSHVVIYSGVNRRFLVTFNAPCSGLSFAQRLAYRTPGGSLGRHDRLTVVGQGLPVDCVIDSIQPLEKIAG